jgi:tetratricopeptide (TPR) repeat protein
VPVDPPEMKAQREKFNKAMELFHAREFKKARDLFEQAFTGPSREISFAAKTHFQMCEQRLDKQAVRLETADDYYNYGVALTNERQLEEARKNLQKAVSMRQADHYEYALALCLGLIGDIDGAAKHLAKAIELDPRNRIAARNDADFAELLHHAALQAVLHPGAAA